MGSFSAYLELFFHAVPKVLEAIFTLIAAASVFTAATKTPRDDEVLGKIYRVVEILALTIGRAKEPAPNRFGGRFIAD
jgi:hypothetical protein